MPSRNSSSISVSINSLNDITGNSDQFGQFSKKLANPN